MNYYTPPVEIAAVLASLFFILALVNQAARLWYSLRGKPTPAEMASASATLSERIGKIESCVGACQADHSRRIASLEANQVAMRETISSEVDKVFRRITAVADTVGEISGEVGGIKRNVELLLQQALQKNRSHPQ